MQSSSVCKGYVSVAESSFVWQEGQGLGVKTFEGLTTSFEAGKTHVETHCFGVQESRIFEHTSLLLSELPPEVI